MLQGKKVAILATHGYEQSELEVPLKSLRDAGADVKVVSLKNEPIRAVKGMEWTSTVDVDLTVDQISADKFDALVLPGGHYNPDTLRTNDRAVKFVLDMFNQKKPIGAICHGPWVLIEAGVVKNRTLTSYHSIKTDLKNAGANWVDKEVVVHNGLVTSRQPDDLEAFCDKLIEEIAEGQHEKRRTEVA